MNTQEWLAKLVAFDTTSRNSNLELIAVIQSWLAEHGISVTLTQDASGKKANLFATLPAQDGAVNDGIILSGHTDVVPVDGQQWESDPFHLSLRKDRLYGRGTCDMKGFIAVVLALLPEFQQFKYRQPVHFAFSYDEEVGCLGAPLLIEDFQRKGFKPTACIVGEPTDMNPVVGHKGSNGFRCRVEGKAAHSSLTPHGCNAIEYAARLICYLRDLSEELKQNGPQDESYDVPFTSMTTNLIQGGNATNTIPASCEFFFEFRNLPETKPRELLGKIEKYIQNELLPKMRMEHVAGSIEINFVASAPSFAADEQTAIVKLVRALTQEQKKLKVSYATEAGLFQHAGIPTIVCGPGNIEQAHRANEYVSLEQLRRCEVFLRALVSNVGATGGRPAA